MPAAAVIPTPRVSMMDAAVKKSVVVGTIKRHGSKMLSLSKVVERTGRIVYTGER